MTNEREYVKRTPGRRQDDYLSRCFYCEIKDEQSRERWQTLHNETEERQKICSSIISDLKREVKGMDEKKADKFTLSLAITILISAWILVSGVNTYLIQSLKSEIISQSRIISTDNHGHKQ